MHINYQILITMGISLFALLCNFCTPIKTLYESTAIVDGREAGDIYLANVVGEYIELEENLKLELKADGSFSTYSDSLETNGKFEMNDWATITFKKENAKATKGSVRGNILTCPDEREWVKKIKNEDVAGKYFIQKDGGKNDYIKLNVDGSLHGILESNIKVNGRYKIDFYYITLILHDLEGKYKDEEIRLKYGSDVPGRGHDILGKGRSEIVLVKKFEKIKTITKYILEDIEEESYLELKADGSFFIKVEPNTINGIYEIDGDVIHLQMGMGGIGFTAQIKNNYVIIDALHGHKGRKWQKE